MKLIHTQARQANRPQVHQIDRWSVAYYKRQEKLRSLIEGNTTFRAKDKITVQNKIVSGTKNVMRKALNLFRKKH